MTAEGDESAGEAQAERSGLRGALYWVIAVGIALVSIRVLLRLLADAGIIAEEDGNVMLVVAVPIALFTIGRMAPDRVRRK